MNRAVKKLGLVSAVAAIVGIGIYYYSMTDRGPIYEFDSKRDTQDIVQLYEANRYWLTANEFTSIEFTLQHKTPGRSPLYMGRLHIKVLREQGKFIGFTAYYKETASIGRVLYVAVDSTMRGKRYGQQLLEYAVADLIKLGSSKIVLLTRTSNTSAQALYRRLGFVESFKEDGFVHFEYIPSTR